MSFCDGNGLDWAEKWTSVSPWLAVVAAVKQWAEDAKAGAYTRPLFGLTSKPFEEHVGWFWCISVTRTVQVELRSGRVYASARRQRRRVRRRPRRQRQRTPGPRQRRRRRRCWCRAAHRLLSVGLLGGRRVQGLTRRSPFSSTTPFGVPQCDSRFVCQCTIWCATV